MRNRIKLVLVASLLLAATMLILGAFKIRAQEKAAVLISQVEDRIVLSKTNPD